MLPEIGFSYATVQMPNTVFAVSIIITGLQLLDVCNHIHGYSLLLENVFDMPDAV